MTVWRYEPYRGDAALADRIADFHAGVRTAQIISGEAQFADPEDSQPDLLNIGAYYIRPGGEFFCAYRDQDLVGIAGLRRTGPRSAQIKRVAVHESARGQGCASTLVRSLVEAATALGVTAIDLSTGRRERARPVYLRAGFVDVGRDPSNDDYLMRYTA